MTDLAPGDVLLVRSASAIGTLIRFGERVRYAGWPAALAHLARKLVGTAQPDRPGDPWYVSHAAVYVGDGQLVEALARGLALSPVTKYDRSDTVVVAVADLVPAVTDQDRARAVAFARTQLARHDRYGWLSIASIVLQLTTPAKLDISWDGALICSAFAAQVLEHCGLTLATRSSLTTMPADLAAMATTPHTPTATFRSAA